MSPLSVAVLPIHQGAYTGVALGAVGSIMQMHVALDDDIQRAAV